MTSRWRLFSLAALLVIALDQATKYLVVTTMTLVDVIEVIPGLFNIVSVRNRGAAFGILNSPEIDWQFWLFLAATVIATWAILTLVRRSGYAPLLWAGLGLVWGGALGNLIDRVRTREVVDFLDVYIGTSHWPAFNVADTGICVGAGLALLTIFLGHDRRPMPGAGTEDKR